MKIVELSARQPISIIVGVLFTFLAGLVAVRLVAVEMTPEVEDTVIAVNTFWENASPQEIESEVVDPQEEKLQSLSNLRSITSVSSQGQGLIRLEFNAGIDKNIALRDVSDKLREVPAYPFGVDEPVIEASDPESQDYIAWYILRTDDPDFDVRHLQTFAEDQLKPILERVAGVSEVNALGGTEREVQIEYDAEKLAQYGISLSQLDQKLRESNVNYSAGALQIGRRDVRLRAVGRFTSPESITKLVLRNDPESGPVTVGDVAVVHESFKEPSAFVRASGRRAIAFNFQREPGSNVLDIMDEIAQTVAKFNQPGDILEAEAKRLGLNGSLRMNISYDATRYVRQALEQVQNNIYIGGALAIAVLLLFLRSLRSLGIIAISIPVSMVGAVVLMVALGRTVNVISLAGIAFAVGMVVDNSIVVLENIYRHLEMGKKKFEAAVEGTAEVAGAVLASSLTTLIVFIPILLITDQVGQLFRDISLSIMTAVAFSYIVAVTVIPAAAAKILNHKRYQDQEERDAQKGSYERFLLWLLKSNLMRAIVVVVMSIGSIWGAYVLMPPLDYLPKGNRNITFGLMLTPPGLNINQLEDMGKRVEAQIRPYWEDQPNRPAITEAYTGRQVSPTSLTEYFLVSRGGILFHGGISSDDLHAVDNVALLQHATRQDVLPGVFSFAFQFPLFRLGGSTGSAVKINLIGRDLNKVSDSAGALFGALFQTYGPGAARPDPSNFNINVQEVQLRIDEAAVAQAGLTRSDVVLAMQAAGDGIFLGEYEFQGDLIDLKLWTKQSQSEAAISKLDDVPIATPNGQIMRLGQLAKVIWTEAAEKIKRVGRRRAVTLEFTAPPGAPLEQVVKDLEGIIAGLKMAGAISNDVTTEIEGSAGKLSEIRKALLGDSSLGSFMASSMFTSFIAIYLLMCILFQSWFKPFVIMFTVPLATFGGFLGLYIVHEWSLSDPYMAIQNLDVLTLLGFIILAGVVVNNAILIVAQAEIYLKDEKYSVIEAIAKASQSRVRPIFMSMLTSVGGMLPLILNPGSGSELYRGLGAVVVGGMLLSTFFTLILIPVLMSITEQIGRVKDKLKTSSIVAVVVLLSGCQSIFPTSDTKLPKQTIPEHYQFELRQDAYATDWWKSFDDPILAQLLERSFVDNLNLKKLEKRIEEVLALSNRVHKDYYPVVGGGASAKREKLPSFQIPERTNLSVGVDVNMTLDWLGRIKDEQAIADSRLSTVRLQHLQHQRELISQVISAYLNYRHAETRTILAMREVERQKEIADLLLELSKSGLVDVSLVNVQNIQIQLSEESLVNVLSEKEQWRLLLEAWVGADSGGLTELLKGSGKWPEINDLDIGVPNDLLSNRADIAIAANAVLEAAAKLNLSKKEIYPQLFFGGEFNFYGKSFYQWITSNNKGYGFGPQLSWRLFEFGRIKMEKKAAAAAYDQAVLNWRDTVRQALLEVETELEQYKNLQQRLSKKERILKETQLIAARQKNLLVFGRVSKKEWLQAEVEALKSEAVHAQMRLQTALSQTQLYKKLSLSFSGNAPSDTVSTNHHLIETPTEPSALKSTGANVLQVEVQTAQ